MASPVAFAPAIPQRIFAERWRHIVLMPTISLEELPDLLRGGSTHARKRLLAGIAKPGSRLS